MRELLRSENLGMLTYQYVNDKSRRLLQTIEYRGFQYEFYPCKAIQLEDLTVFTFNEMLFPKDYPYVYHLCYNRKEFPAYIGIMRQSVENKYDLCIGKVEFLSDMHQKIYKRVGNYTGLWWKEVSYILQGGVKHPYKKYYDNKSLLTRYERTRKRIRCNLESIEYHRSIK